MIDIKNLIILCRYLSKNDLDILQYLQDKKYFKCKKGLYTNFAKAIGKPKSYANVRKDLLRLQTLKIIKIDSSEEGYKLTINRVNIDNLLKLKCYKYWGK